jgi:hypothetical protein
MHQACDSGTLPRLALFERGFMPKPKSVHCGSAHLPSAHSNDRRSTLHLKQQQKDMDHTRWHSYNCCYGASLRLNSKCVSCLDSLITALAKTREHGMLYWCSSWAVSCRLQSTQLTVTHMCSL